ncbi:uncharacterized protein LOC100377029, partial [Saccoglossus kowalevskii]|uniref:Uncharacterized protein LOC100377029 n=1 Tax=Saccoglossus kowalevskii TaxID=10224 RepID=A0ABM0GRT5_SACKO
MGTVVSLPKLSPLEKQLVSEGKLDRSALSSRASCKIRTLSREQQQAVFTQCQGLLNNIKESKDKQRAETEAALKVEWQDGESVSTEEAEDIVQTCWSRINRQCAQYYRKKNSNKTVTGWRVVRVFVSSTFADFFSEREALVKKVFPELKEWCETRQLQLIECDLRWGVPKDTTTGETIATCLEEIDRCLDETDGEPFFLGMLGERYGWNPTSREVPQDIIHKYEWVPNLSMTHMEILHGAIRNQNPNAVFMLRDPCYMSDIPPDHLKNFLEEDELPKSQLKELKRYLHEEFSDSVFEYSCDVDGVDDSTGREVIQLSKLDEFCEHVLTFFKAAIERTYPHSEHTLTPQQEENEQHRNYVLQKGSTVFGRDRVITNILRFAEGDNQGITDENISLQSSIRDSDTISSSDDIVMNHLTNGELLDSDKSDEQNGDIRVVVENYSSDVGSDSVNSKGSRQRTNMRVRQSRAPSDSWLLVVVGSPGTGKSALMARTVMNAEKAGLDIFYHFVGSCPSSIHYDNLIKRLCKYLLSADDERLVKLDGEYSEEEIIKLLPTLLKERSSRREQLLIVIDAVNQ